MGIGGGRGECWRRANKREKGEKEEQRRGQKEKRKMNAGNHRRESVRGWGKGGEIMTKQGEKRISVDGKIDIPVNNDIKREKSTLKCVRTAW